MGALLIRLTHGAADLAVGAAVEAAGHPAVGRDAGSVAGIGEIGVPVTSDPDALAGADVAVDFSLHTAVPANVRAAAKHGKPVVIGTTGLTADEDAAVRDAARTVPVLRAPNMSRGMNLLFALIEQAARVLGREYDAEIVETHHRHKKDAPSGTALRLAESISRGRGQDPAQSLCYGRRGETGERPAGQIGVHALRAGDEVGEHTVLFATEGERVAFSHRAGSREAFAAGALHAARWLVTRRPGLYDMQDVLGLKNAT